MIITEDDFMEDLANTEDPFFEVIATHDDLFFGYSNPEDFFVDFDNIKKALVICQEKYNTDKIKEMVKNAGIDTSQWYVVTKNAWLEGLNY